jgi:hypothetical protein
MVPHLLSEKHADAISRINDARNQALHFKPGRRLRELEAIRLNAAFHRLHDDGLKALRYVLGSERQP